MQKQTYKVRAIDSVTGRLLKEYVVESATLRGAKIQATRKGPVVGPCIYMHLYTMDGHLLATQGFYGWWDAPVPHACNLLG